ncbi:MAG: calcineurin-like phosphoesterase C-terminal domain-containing protein, partial [Bacteroidales bacterium]|nr:calcineurin-like phosphoesterase C-terminal domain-containing protein [Bacteroidales bacterium]
MMRKVYIALLAAAVFAGQAFGGNLKGRVLADGKPLEGVWVTDGEVFCKTNGLGRYEFDSSKKLGMVFIEIPSGFVPESRDALRPQFWQYLNLPVNREEIHDFNLYSQDQSAYRVLLPTDFHLSNDPRKKDLAQFAALVTPLARKIVAAENTPVYTFHLGDFTHDIFWYEFGFNEAEGVRFLQDQRWPTLFYNVMGNHDHDGAIIGEDVDWRAGWLWRDCFGPDRLSWNIGGDHWIFLDDIIYKNTAGGKRGPGIKGLQNYSHGLTDSQLEWLQKDLSHTDKNARVFLCMHAPLLWHDWRDSGESLHPMVDEAVTARINLLASEFAHGITVFSGHIHGFDAVITPDFPYITQYSMPATSGDQWKSPIGMIKAEGDGSPAGMMVIGFAEGKEPQMHFETLAGTFYPYRVYDLNVVGKAYAASKEIKTLFSTRPERVNYSNPKWKNCILVNYWYWRPGDRVEMFENGKALRQLNL